MKNFKNTALTAALSLLSIVAAAGPWPTVVLKKERVKSFTLHLKAIRSEKIEVRLRDTRNFLLLEEVISGCNSYSTIFNLENLPDGKYFLEVENEYAILLRSVEIRHSSLSLPHGSEKSVFKPVFEAGASHVGFTLLQLADSVTQVKMVDAQHRVIFKETIPQSGSISRRFNISQLEEGAYSLVVTVGDRSFYRNFTVKFSDI